MKITAIIPSLNPDEKLLQVVTGLQAAGFDDILLVDDGSRPENQAPFQEAAALQGVTVLRHPENRGKGRALKTAFQWCLENRPESLGVVTVDGDNQHRPQDVLRLAEAIREDGAKLWLGVRDFSLPNVPKRSRMGNTITRTALRLTCGVGVTDSQTGLRAIPAALLPRMLQVRGERFEYETEMLLETRRAGVPIGEKVIETVYIDENQTSHYRPLWDSLRILRMILRYLSCSLVCFAVDQGLFALVNVLLAARLPEETRLLAATGGARLCSSLINYALNRRVVFQDSGAVRTSMVRYYLLAAAQAACSYGLVYLLGALSHAGVAGESGWKAAVDILLFFVSYQVQLRWVFAGRGSSK